MMDLTFKQSEEFKLFANVEVYDGPIRIGVAKLSRNGNIAILADIIIHNHKKRIIKFLPFYKHMNYRRNGIGTELLKKTIFFCRQHNIRVIQGKVVGDTKVLVHWYKKHGFTVNDRHELYMEVCAKQAHQVNSNASVV